MVWTFPWSISAYCTFSLGCVRSSSWRAFICLPLMKSEISAWLSPSSDGTNTIYAWEHCQIFLDSNVLDKQRQVVIEICELDIAVAWYDAVIKTEPLHGNSLFLFFLFWKEQKKIKRRDMSKEIFYSDRYQDETFEYRFVGIIVRVQCIWLIFSHVILPKELIPKIPKDHLMSEPEWRALGVKQSAGWVHYDVFKPEPNVLLFRRPRTDK